MGVDILMMPFSLKDRSRIEGDIRRVNHWMELHCPQERWSAIQHDVQNVAGRLRDSRDLPPEHRIAMERLHRESLRAAPDFNEMQKCWAPVAID